MGPASRSSEPYDPATLLIGRLGRPHGLRGEIVFHPYSGSLLTLEGLKELILEVGAGREVRAVRSARRAGNHLIMALEGVSSRAGAAALTHADIRVPREALPPLGPGEFYVGDLLGCEVSTREDARLGRVEGTFWNGAHDVMTVRDRDQERLIPVVPGHVLEVDLPARRVVVAWVDDEG